MRRPFNELLETMEQRLRQVEEGQAPSTHGEALAYGLRGRASGCPDEETLCGWVDGQLRGENLQRWLAVWGHVQVRRCRYCRGELQRLTAAIHLEGQTVAPDQLRRVRRGRVLTYLTSLWAAAKAKGSGPRLAWAGGAVVVMVSLSLWSIPTHESFETIRGHSVADDLRILPQVEVGNPADAMDHNTAIWGG